MQLLVRYDTSSFDSWKADFDGAAETRMNAGLTLLQMWRDADDDSAALCLFEVNQRESAEAWLARDTAHDGKSSATFIETA